MGSVVPVLAAGLNESRQGGCTPCRPHTLDHRLEATPLLPFLSDKPALFLRRTTTSTSTALSLAAISHKKAPPHTRSAQGSSSHTHCSRLFSKRLLHTTTVQACPKPPLYNPTRRRLLRPPPLIGPSPWAWPFPSRPIGQRTRPVGVAWGQGNHPPKIGPHLFSPLTSGNRRE